MRRRRRVGWMLLAYGVTATVAGLAISPAASGAAVAIVAPSPDDGTVLPTQRPPYRVPLHWRADMTGCTSPTARAEVVVIGPDGLITRGGIEGSPPSGGQSFVVTALRRMTHRWYVELACADLPAIRSEIRTFTVAGPNPEPRLAGRHEVTFPAAGVSEVWRFRPLCRSGACGAIVTRPGAPPARIRYDRRRRVYRGTIRRVPRAAEAVCALPRDGRSPRNVPNTYRGREVAITLRVAQTAVDSSGTQRLARRLLGRSSGFYVPNAKGRARGCRAGRITTQVVMDRVVPGAANGASG